MKNMITFAVSDAAACPSSVVGYRSASARVAPASWRLPMGATAVGVTARTSVAPTLGTDLRHTFVDLFHGSRSRTRCRLK